VRGLHRAHQRTPDEFVPIFAAMHEGDEITTIEGLGQPENLHPDAGGIFVRTMPISAGYCTSGQIMFGDGAVERTVRTE